MGCHKIHGNGVTGFVCLPNIYEFGGFTFEWHRCLGPVKLRKKDFSAAKKEGRMFFCAVEQWERLDDESKRKTLVFS